MSRTAACSMLALGRGLVSSRAFFVNFIHILLGLLCRLGSDGRCAQVCEGESGTSARVVDVKCGFCVVG